MSKIDFSQMLAPEVLAAAARRREVEATIALLVAELASTDWLVIREAEGGAAMGADIREARGRARAEISQLRDELQALPAA